MKPLFLLSMLFACQFGLAQHLDFLSIRKGNGRVIKNIYTGSDVVLQTTNGSYLAGPVEVIQNDSLFIRLYDVRMYRTNFGGIVRDTITTTLAGINYKDIARVQLYRSRSFAKHSGPSLLMAGGAGYFALNVVNGALFSLPLTDTKNIKALSISGGAFLLGFLVRKFSKTDGFSTKRHRIVYINLGRKEL